MIINKYFPSELNDSGAMEQALMIVTNIVAVCWTLCLMRKLCIPQPKSLVSIY